MKKQMSLLTLSLLVTTTVFAEDKPKICDGINKLKCVAASSSVVAGGAVHAVANSNAALMESVKAEDLKPKTVTQIKDMKEIYRSAKANDIITVTTQTNEAAARSTAIFHLESEIRTIKSMQSELADLPRRILAHNATSKGSPLDLERARELRNRLQVLHKQVPERSQGLKAYEARLAELKEGGALTAAEKNLHTSVHRGTYASKYQLNEFFKSLRTKRWMEARQIELVEATVRTTDAQLAQNARAMRRIGKVGLVAAGVGAAIIGEEIISSAAERDVTESDVQILSLRNSSVEPLVTKANKSDSESLSPAVLARTAEGAQ